MKRRHFLAALGLGAIGVGAQRYWPEGWVNPCLDVRPALDDPHIAAALQGIDAAQLWDCHVHLVGVGDGLNGHRDSWVHPEMHDVASPLRYAQYRFYLNAACPGNGPVDAGFVSRLRTLQAGLPAGARLMLLAFEHYHDGAGAARQEDSTFHIANDYAARIAQENGMEWIASIHPYRPDAVVALDAAVAAGARAIKWLPPAMGMDPADARCDAFYTALRRHGLPLLVHCGDEHAVRVKGTQHLGNPLRLRRALDQGVRVIMAHCAGLGESEDLDDPQARDKVRNFALFTRLMDEPGYQGLLHGDISAVTQINYPLTVIRTLIERRDWHDRLLFGSDYPLPGIVPLTSLRRFVRAGLLDADTADWLKQIREYNPILFDLLLKRSLRLHGDGFSAAVFHSRGVFDGPLKGSLRKVT